VEVLTVFVFKLVLFFVPCAYLRLETAALGIIVVNYLVGVKGIVSNLPKV